MHFLPEIRCKHKEMDINHDSNEQTSSSAATTLPMHLDWLPRSRIGAPTRICSRCLTSRIRARACCDGSTAAGSMWAIVAFCRTPPTCTTPWRRQECKESGWQTWYGALSGPGWSTTYRSASNSRQDVGCSSALMSDWPGRMSMPHTPLSSIDDAWPVWRCVMYELMTTVVSRDRDGVVIHLDAAARNAVAVDGCNGDWLEMSALVRTKQQLISHPYRTLVG